jgi:hypothetical protein
LRKNNKVLIEVPNEKENNCDDCIDAWILYILHSSE